MNADALIAELQHNYFLVKEAVSKIKFDNIVEYDLFLAAGFRSAWASSWQRAGRSAQGASGPQSTGSTLPTSTCDGTERNSSVNITVPMAVACSPKAEIAELPDATASGAGAQCFLAQLLRTRALTVSQYKALCRTCAIPAGSHPTEQDVMRLDFKACVSVLCGDGGRA